MFPGSSRSLDTRATIQALIERACDQFRPEPDMALNLEICDIINTKKANTPREAAVEVVRLINSRNQHVSMLALALLDCHVKNCGYPFHLQISTKDFLNELVRRFPERPPPFPPAPMTKILELIHEWKSTLCVTSKYKEDLVHVRDMYRLLSYKGYRFPQYDKRAASVLNPASNIKSADELEEEDRVAQAAKLQELIRRGTPKDLAAAQELMKVMAGANPDKAVDYEQQSARELQTIQQRVLLLNEMMNNAKPEEKLVDGDAYDQIATRCKQVQPKLQQWIQEAYESKPDQMDKLLLINDLINNVLKRYDAYRKGDRTVSAEINPAFSQDGSNDGTASRPSNLIDFDEEEAAKPATRSASLPDGLAGLDLSGPSSSTLLGNGTAPWGSTPSLSPAPTGPSNGHYPIAVGAIQLGGAMSAAMPARTPPAQQQQSATTTTSADPFADLDKFF